MSMPRSWSRSSTFRRLSGYFTYISTARRITSGDELKQRNGLGDFARDLRFIAAGITEPNRLPHWSDNPHRDQQSKIDCINKPNRRLHPTNATASFSLATREPSTEDIRGLARRQAKHLGTALSLRRPTSALAWSLLAEMRRL